jgi:hypothetical protein
MLPSQTECKTLGAFPFFPLKASRADVFAAKTAALMYLAKQVRLREIARAEP